MFENLLQNIEKLLNFMWLYDTNKNFYCNAILYYIVYSKTQKPNFEWTKLRRRIFVMVEDYFKNCFVQVKNNNKNKITVLLKKIIK